MTTLCNSMTRCMGNIVRPAFAVVCHLDRLRYCTWCRVIKFSSRREHPSLLTDEPYLQTNLIHRLLCFNLRPSLLTDKPAMILIWIMCEKFQFMPVIAGVVQAVVLPAAIRTSSCFLDLLTLMKPVVKHCFLAQPAIS